MVDAYNTVNTGGKRVEVIYISGDKDQKTAYEQTPDNFLTIPLSESGPYKKEYKL